MFACYPYCFARLTKIRFWLLLQIATPSVELELLFQRQSRGWPSDGITRGCSYYDGQGWVLMVRRGSAQTMTFHDVYIISVRDEHRKPKTMHAMSDQGHERRIRCAL